MPYLNALPLTAGIEGHLELLPPSELARRLREKRLDAALVSSTEVLFSEHLRALDGFGILSRGPVYSVFLAHRTPLEQLRTVQVDPASCTSVNLLRVLLAERGIHPEFQPLTDYEEAVARDDVLLIGNPAITFRRAPHDHQLWDLGAAWQEATGKPFTYAVWAFRDDFDPAPLAQALTEVAASGLVRLDQLIDQSSDFDLQFRREYVGGHIQYRLDEPAKQGLSRFSTLLERTSGRRVHPLRWIHAE